VRNWEAAEPREEKFVHLNGIAPYEPGSFYRRELPCLLACINLFAPADFIVIDGYVSLDSAGTPGLGGHLYDALPRKTAVIGVAKTKFKDAAWAIPILRGTSRTPLYITAIGIDAADAANRVRQMHGNNRMPTILKRTDRLCRDRLVGG